MLGGRFNKKEAAKFRCNWFLLYLEHRWGKGPLTAHILDSTAQGRWARANCSDSSLFFSCLLFSPSLSYHSAFWRQWRLKTQRRIWRWQPFWHEACSAHQQWKHLLRTHLPDFFNSDGAEHTVTKLLTVTRHPRVKLARQLAWTVGRKGGGRWASAPPMCV